MQLQLKEGWEIGKRFKLKEAWEDPLPDWVYPASKNWESAYAQFVDNKVYVYPHGEYDHFEFDSIKDAHAYLISVGSESPWELTL